MRSPYPHEDVLRISCDDCALYDSSWCEDCVVTFLCGGRGASSTIVSLDASEVASLGVFQRAGLAPRLRYSKLSAAIAHGPE